MGVRFYDEALVEKIKNWVKDPNIRILKPDESTRLFEMELDLKKDKPLTLPLIAISRNRDIEILNTAKHAPTYDGFTQSKTAKNIIQLNAIPIQLGYQIDIYTKGMAEADEYMRNFVFNFINYPKLNIEIPYNNLKLTHDSIITLESNITDNSDIKEHLFADQFVRFTIKIAITDAYFFSLPISLPTNIAVVDLQVADPDGNIIKDTVFIAKND